MLQKPGMENIIYILQYNVSILCFGSTIGAWVFHATKAQNEKHYTIHTNKVRNRKHYLQFKI
jgi:hypothetical protein